MMEKLNAQMRRMDRHGKAANGSAVKFLGKTTIEIEISSRTKIKAEVAVAQEGHCPTDMIIGHDLCKQMEAQFDFKAKQINLLGETIPINVLLEDEVEPKIVKRNKVIIPEKTTIKPGDNFLWTYATNPLEAGTTWLITQTPKFNIKHMVVGATVMKVNKHQKVPVRIYNNSNIKLEIHPGTITADMELIEDEKPQVNLLLEDQEYVPEEADISKDLPLFPQPGVDNRQFLMENINLDKSILSVKGKRDLISIILSHQNAFVGADGKIGNYNGPIKHSITLINTDKFIAERPRRIPPALQETVQAQIKEMLDQHIIRPSTSPFCSPIVMVRKADKKSWRMAIDYRKLNAETKKQSNFLPLINDIIDKVAGKQFYTSLDLQGAFHQVSMNEHDINKTAFAVNSDLYEFLRMPFGLCGAPATFQKIMNQVKKEVKAVIFCYLDDIILVSTTEAEHLQDIDEVLTTMERNQLRMKLSKCTWATDELKYCGLLVSKNGIRPDPANVEKVKNFKTPSTLTELRSVIGAISYFRRFIEGFAAIMSPLHDLTTKGENVKANWNEHHEKAFRTVIQKLVEAPVLAPPQFGKAFEIHTDASKEAAAAVLLQADNDNHLHPVVYFSRKMNKAERNYSSIELEALAIVCALKEFRAYIEGAPTTIIRTDSSACCSLMKNKNLQGRLAKFQLAIMAFNVHIIHRSGKSNHLCDYMSRFPINAITLRSGKAIASATPLKTVIEEQLVEYPDIVHALRHKKYPADSEQRKALEHKMKHLVMKNGAIYFFNEDEGDDLRLLVPYNLRQKLLKEFHDDILQGGHLGQMKTLEKMRQRVFWPAMATDVKEYVKGCELCQKGKIQPGDNTPEPLNPIKCPEYPFDRVHVDIAGPLVKSTDGKKYCLVIIDAFSKFIVAVPMVNQTARTVSLKFIEHVLCKHGSCNQVTTDCGRQFISTIFQELAKIYHFSHRVTTPYHQSANGQVERQMRTIASMLRGSVSISGEEWTELLPMVIFAYNTSVQSSTKQSPFFVLHGREARLPSDVALQIPAKMANQELSTFVQDLVMNIQNSWRVVKENIQEAQEEQTFHADQQRQAAEKHFKIGQLVLHKINAHRAGEGHKFAPKWKGPLILFIYFYIMFYF
uniref:Reverse transcriptase n=1 Tax=Panagrolaimus sp. ES5 TaxID=591445 RepID=A0AC34FUF8_9BILA